MILHKHKAIFIHIPKCAGTSIEKALGHFEKYQGRDRQDHRSVRMLEPLRLKSLSSAENTKEVIKRLWFLLDKPKNPKNSYVVTKEQYESYFKFSIVRNPWTRAYSWYKNVQRDELTRKEFKIHSQIDFYNFLKLYINKNILRPQIFWLKNFKGAIDLDYIGRFENLPNDFKIICDLMKIEPIIFPHELKGTDEGYQDAYDDNSINLIRSFYKEEIELFNYSFD
jgi:hypothetical protein